MKGNETIFGLASGQGKSGVAVTRISGKSATAALEALGVKTPKPRDAVLRKLKFNEQVIDHALVLYFPAPHSFTGEDVVELHTHGSRAVVKKLFEVLSGLNNLRLAEPGEFSRRAFLNNKMDLLEAEGLADLIDAETTAQAKQAMRQMEGELGKIYENWRKGVIKLLANIEAYIDFPDEDLPTELATEIVSQISNIKSQISNYLNDEHRGEKIRDGIYMVILGAPNVGKSSLLNYLARRDAAIVSDIAGTTRDVIEVNMEIAGLPVTIADTAGLRESADVIESEGIKRALARAEKADLKILLLDAADKKPDLSLVDENTILVVNKIDSVRCQISDVRCQISIKTGEGLEALLKLLTEKLTNKFHASEAPLITRARHREALQAALDCLNNINLKNPIELIAEDLRHTAFNIGRITGRIDVEDILDVVFSSFCIGK
jgi:tRNA modification GTPase